jgi:hypothetical protein
MHRRGISNVSIAATALVGVLVVLSFTSYTYYLTNSSLASLSSQNSSLNGQVANLGGQIQGLNQQVASLQQKTVQVVTVQNTIETVETTTWTTTFTVTSVTAVPQSTLVITADHYSAANKTYYFQVQDTQNFVVYAQISASVTGDCGCAYNFMGFYISQIYQLMPLATSTLSYNLTLTSYNGGNMGQKPVDITLTLQTANNVAVSPTYTFQYPSTNLVT